MTRGPTTGESRERFMSDRGRILHSAEIVLPMAGARPIRNGGVVVDSDGVVLSAGPLKDLVDATDERQHHQILMPGLVNAHIHATDAIVDHPVGGGDGLVAWVSDLLTERRQLRDRVTESEFAHSVSSMIRVMMQRGTVAVGEVANDYATLRPIADTGIHVRFMHEALGWSEAASIEIERLMESQRAAESWSASVSHAFALHAPYSTSRTLALRLQQRSREMDSNLYIHLAEDIEERVLYVAGDGAWRRFLDTIGAWDDAWIPPGITPIRYYDALGLIDHRFVAVHLADATAHEIALLARRGASAVLSPRSNAHITGLVPNVPTMVRYGLPFAFGTDGRGSNASVDVMDEARDIAERFPWLPPGVLLEGLTWNGARVLGFSTLGRIAPTGGPGLVSLEVEALPETYGDVERAILFDCRKREVAVPAPDGSRHRYAS